MGRRCPCRLCRRGLDLLRRATAPRHCAADPGATSHRGDLRRSGCGCWLSCNPWHREARHAVRGLADGVFGYRSRCGRYRRFRVYCGNDCGYIVGRTHVPRLKLFRNERSPRRSVRGARPDHAGWIRAGSSIAKLSRKTLTIAADFCDRVFIENSALPTLSGTQDFRDIQPRDRDGRFIVKSSVTSCRSAADEIATVRNLPSGYVLASS